MKCIICKCYMSNINLLDCKNKLFCNKCFDYSFLIVKYSLL